MQTRMVIAEVAVALGTLAVLLLAARQWRTGPPAPVETLPGHERLGPLATDLRDAFRAERVAVIAADPDRADEWRVAACTGARVPFSKAELTLIERLARTRAPEFERRHRARVA